MENYKRDVFSNALINNDKKAFEDYKRKRDVILKQKRETEDIFSSIEERLTRIENLLEK